MTKGFIARRSEGTPFPLSYWVKKTEYDKADKGTVGSGIWYQEDPDNEGKYLKTYAFNFMPVSAIEQLEVIEAQVSMLSVEEVTEVQELSQTIARAREVIERVAGSLVPDGHETKALDIMKDHLNAEQQNELLSILKEMSGIDGQAKPKPEDLPQPQPIKATTEEAK